MVRAETSPAVSRAFALTTGTVGLFAIAVLVLAVTPGKQPQPFAVSATTVPATILPGADETDGATIASARGATPTAQPGSADPVAVRALATPIGEGQYALVSQASIGHSASTELDVTLPSGRVTIGYVVERSADTVLIVLSEAEPGHEVAEQRPHDREVVTVMAQPPVTIAYADISTLEVAEGTAVVDSEGNLVGLCTRSGHGRVRLIAVDAAMTTPDDTAVATDDDVTAGPDEVTTVGPHEDAPGDEPATTADDDPEASTAASTDASTPDASTAATEPDGSDPSTAPTSSTSTTTTDTADD